MIRDVAMSGEESGCLAVIGVILFTVFVVIPTLVKLTPYKVDRNEALCAENIIAQYEKSVAMAERNAIATVEEEASVRRKEEKIRTFALKESPAIWQTIQKLRAEKESLETGIARVEAVLQHFGRDAQQPFGRDAGCDPDVIRLKQDLSETEKLLDRLWAKLEDAYLKYVAYQEMPGQNDLKELCDRALSDGAQEASAIENRFIRMREQK